MNAARSALYLLNDPEDEDARLVVHTKSNYARGYEVKAGVRVKKNGTSLNGFSIAGLEASA